MVCPGRISCLRSLGFARPFRDIPSAAPHARCSESRYPGATKGRARGGTRDLRAQSLVQFPASEYPGFHAEARRERRLLSKLHFLSLLPPRLRVKSCFSLLDTHFRGAVLSTACGSCWPCRRVVHAETRRHLSISLLRASA